MKRGVRRLVEPSFMTVVTLRPSQVLILVGLYDRVWEVCGGSWVDRGVGLIPEI